MNTIEYSLLTVCDWKRFQADETIFFTLRVLVCFFRYFTVAPALVCARVLFARLLCVCVFLKLFCVLTWFRLQGRHFPYLWPSRAHGVRVLERPQQAGGRQDHARDRQKGDC